MTDPLALTSLEMQALLRQFEAYGVPAELIQQAAALHTHELIRHRERVTVEVLTIGEQMEQHFSRLAAKFEADLQSRFGATDAMLVDLLQGQRESDDRHAESEQDRAHARQVLATIAQQVDHLTTANAGVSAEQRLSVIRTVETHDRLLTESVADRQAIHTALASIETKVDTLISDNIGIIAAQQAELLRAVNESAIVIKQHEEVISHLTALLAQNMVRDSAPGE